jgi:ADP-heptose:LPS heptosyltransferase
VLGPTGFFDDVMRFSVPWRLRDLLIACMRIRALAPRRLYYLAPMPRTARQVARDQFFFGTLCGIPDIAGLRETPPYPVRDSANALVRLEPESDRLLASIAGGPISPTVHAGAHRLPIDQRARDLAAARLAGTVGARLIAIGPGSKMPAKMWPQDRFAAVGSALLTRYPDVRLVLLGAPGERNLGDELAAAWGKRSLNLVGQLSIWESAAVLERCSLYIGNDTGTMHLAASVGTPCVAIFSARDNPGRWEPAGRGHIVLRHEVPCSGCVLTHCTEHAQQCLTAISVDHVVNAAMQRLQLAGTAA